MKKFTRITLAAVVLMAIVPRLLAQDVPDAAPAAESASPEQILNQANLQHEAELRQAEASQAKVRAAAAAASRSITAPRAQAPQSDGAIPRATRADGGEAGGRSIGNGKPNNGVPLRSGDTVELRIANVPVEDQAQWNAIYMLDEDGMLNLPFIGRVKVSGLPPSRVEIMIQSKLIDAKIYTNPTILVNPPAGMRFISLGGAVKIPGRQPYSSDLTLMSAISAGGGPSDFAGDKIRLTRAGKVVFYSRKKLRKDPSQDPHIEPGDQIELVESWF